MRGLAAGSQPPSNYEIVEGEGSFSLFKLYCVSLRYLPQLIGFRCSILMRRCSTSSVARTSVSVTLVAAPDKALNSNNTGAEGALEENNKRPLP